MTKLLATLIIFIIVLLVIAFFLAILTGDISLQSLSQIWDRIVNLFNLINNWRI